MEEKNKLAQEMTLTQSLQILATAYEEISIMKMRIARDSVLHTRDFLLSLSDVFVNVKSSYRKKLKENHSGANAPSILQFSTHATNGKTIFILLTSANKLYGDIISKTFHLFKETLQKETSVDVAIVGKTGKELYDESFTNHSYTYFDFPDVIPSVIVLKPLIALMLQYEHVTVFYGRFVNVVAQEAVATSITGDNPLEKESEGSSQNMEKFGFIFEPSLDELLNFFETQIFSSLFKQTFAEAELARLASRIKAMEQAIVFINTRIGSITSLQRRAKRNLENRKQLERVTGMRMWKK